MKIGEVVYARTHADLLNELLERITKHTVYNNPKANKAI